MQRQEEVDNPTRDIVIWESFFKQKTITVPYKGAFYQVHVRNNGERVPIHIKHVVTPSKDQWVNILKDGESLFNHYIYGFIVAGMGWPRTTEQWVGMSKREPVSTAEYCYIEDSSAFSDGQRADFLEALYSIGQLDITMELPSWSDKYSMIGEFIARYQSLLVNRLAKKGQSLSSEGIQEVAKLGVRSDLPVAPRMISSAFTSAVATAKLMIENLAIEMNKIHHPESQVHVDLSYNNMVSKYGMIIDDSLKGYEAELQGIADQNKALFETVWSIVPLGGLLDKIDDKVITHFASIALDKAKEKIVNNLGKASSSDLSTINEFKEEFRIKVQDLTSILEDCAGSKLPSQVISNAVSTFINSF